MLFWRRVLIRALLVVSKVVLDDRTGAYGNGIIALIRTVAVGASVFMEVLIAVLSTIPGIGRGG